MKDKTKDKNGLRYEKREGLHSIVKEGVKPSMTTRLPEVVETEAKEEKVQMTSSPNVWLKNGGRSYPQYPTQSFI